MCTTTAARMRRARERVSVTQDRLAARIGSSRMTIINWEAGRSEPSLEYVRRIADALDCSPGWLAFGEGELAAEPAEAA